MNINTRKKKKLIPSTKSNYTKIDLCKNDMVKIVKGKEKNNTGRVSRFDRKTGLVYVQNLNTVQRAMKKTSKKEKGKYTTVTHGIHVSNVRFLDEEGNVTKISDIKKQS